MTKLKSFITLIPEELFDNLFFDSQGAVAKLVQHSTTDHEIGLGVGVGSGGGGGFFI